MQYAISISYKYAISKLCILLYPFGLHHLPSPAPPEPQHWTRERLDTLRQHRSGRSASPRSDTRTKGHGDSTSGRAAPEIKPRSETPEEPEPARRQQRRQDRPADTKPHQSRRDRARAREPEARHCKTMSGDGDREKGKRGKKRGNEEKTTVKRRFSPRLTERPADQPPEPAQHRQTRTAAETPPFSVLLLWSMRNQRRSTPVLTIRKAGTVHIFTTSPTPKIWLCTLFSMPLSFSPNHHLTNTPFINDIFPYKYKYPLLQSSLRKNALINADSSSS